MGGFSLVEIMVALLIGMLGIIVMMQVFAMFEGQKRTATSGDDAISGGAIALHELVRELKHSGWGIVSPYLLGCEITDTAFSLVGHTLHLAPVTINSSLITGQDANTDTLLIVSGNSNGVVEGDLIQSDAVAGATFSLKTPQAFTVGEVALAVSRKWPPQCNDVGKKLVYTKVSATGINSMTLNKTVTVKNGDRLFSLGLNPSIKAWAIRNGSLSVCNLRTHDCSEAGSWLAVANNMVGLRAQYGRDTNAAGMDGVVDVWDRKVATSSSIPPVSGNAAKNTNSCGIARVSSLRIALLARSSKPEKRTDGTTTSTGTGSYVTERAPLWAGSVPDPEPGDITPFANFVLPSPSPVWPTWQDFRYKVFETTLPLRNINIQGVLPEC